MVVLLTGANGFLGKYIKSAFPNKSVVTLGLSDCYISLDLSNSVPCFSRNFDLVIHAAGLAHFNGKSKNLSQLFFKVNVHGTSNLLKGLEQSGNIPDTFVFVSTVAVYGVEKGENINESHPLNGGTPYSDSKIEAENLVRNWGSKNGIKVLILRLPLVVGLDPPGNLGVMINAIKKGYYLSICNGDAKRSMVLAQDVAVLLKGLNFKNGNYNLTDGYHPSIREMENYIAAHFKCNIKSIPYPLIKFIAKFGNYIPACPLNEAKLAKLTNTLTFDDTKAKTELAWKPRKILDNFFL